MSRTFIFLTLLFVSSFCIEKKPDNVNQIIDELVALNTNVGTPASQMGELVEQIGAAAHDTATAYTKWYSGVEANCAAGFKYLKSFHEKLEGDRVGAQASVASFQSRMRKNTASAAKLVVQVKAGKATLRNAHARMVKERSAYRVALLEAEGKITVIRHVRNIVVDELLNGNAPASLIQVTTITSKLQELKTMVQKDNDSIFATVVGSLLEMVTEKNLNDQKILRKFLGALSKLNNKIRAWRTSTLKRNKEQHQIDKATAKARLTSLRALGKLLVEARSAVVAGRNAVEDLTNTVALLTRGLARKAVEAKNWYSLCADQARVNTMFVTAHKSLEAHVKGVSARLMNLK
jgi:hypothetical protein